MSVRSHLALVLAVPAMLALTPRVAAAQGSTGELRDEVYQHRIAGELGFFHRSDDTGSFLLLQPGLHAQIGIVEAQEGGPSVQLDIDWRGAGYTSEPRFGDSRSAFRMFNPFLGARVGFASGERDSHWRVRFGGGLTLPLTNAYDSGEDLFTTGVAGLVMTGVWDPWLSTIANMAVVLRGDFEYRHQYFLAGAETAFAVMLPVEYEGRTGNSVFVPQLGVWAAGRPIEQLAIGLRFSAVAQIGTGDRIPGASNVEGFLALSPFVRAELGGGFLEARWVLNLDEPFGPALDDNRFWGFYVGGGAQF